MGRNRAVQRVFIRVADVDAEFGGLAKLKHFDYRPEHGILVFSARRPVAPMNDDAVGLDAPGYRLTHDESLVILRLERYIAPLQTDLISILVNVLDLAAENVADADQPSYRAVGRKSRQPFM